MLVDHCPELVYILITPPRCRQQVALMYMRFVLIWTGTGEIPDLMSSVVTKWSVGRITEEWTRHALCCTPDSDQIAICVFIEATI